MITDAFDTFTEAITSPEKANESTQHLSDICIITFSHHIITEILQQFACVKIAEIQSANGAIPCYKLNYR